MTDESGNSEWSAALKDLELRSRIRWNESLKRFNTWRIGGPSRCLIDVETEEDLAKLLPFIKKNGIHLLTLKITKIIFNNIVKF